MKISALILAKDEEDIIAECIDQLSFADEVIVLDQQSSDNTPQIARAKKAKVYSSKSQNFDTNRNKLKNLAKNDWLLYLDADERLTNSNIEEIETAVMNSEYVAYYFLRRNYILGKFLKYGGWYPDYVPRLFRKSNLIKWEGNVHESPKIEGSFGYLKTPISHFTARNFETMLKKTIKWAKIEAKLAYDSGHPSVSAPKTFKAFMLEFIKRYVLKLGFLDGKIGTIEAIFQSLHRAVFLTYLWEMQNKSSIKEENE